MVNAFRRPARMVQALTILTALQLFSDGGVVPPVEATGEPYGISRDMVEGAARAASAFSTSAPQGGRGSDAIRPVPALSQVTPTITPDSGRASPNSGAAVDPADNEIGHVDSLPLVPERTACNAGLGEMRFEKLPDVRLAPNSYDSDVIRKNAMPSAVLALCEDRCLKDRTATQQLTRRCGSIDFVPGRRYSSYSDSVEYTETKCFLSQPQEETGSSSRAQFERADNYAHLREVCFSSATSSGTHDSVLRRECPDRLYVMERLLAKRFLPKNAVEVGASTLEACQSMCLHQQVEDPQNATTICRSGTWDRGRNRCYLSSYTRRTHPAEFVDDPDMDYFENTCLSPERRCPKNRLFYLKETNAEMGGPFDLVTFVNVTLDQCKEKCIESKTIFCRSMEYDQRARHCVLSDEDSVSRREEIRASTSADNVYLELKCFDGDNVKGEYLFEADAPLGSSNTEQLNDRAFRDVRTAFQLYRNRHLELRSGFRDSRRERSLLTLAECLDECLEERTFACRSVMYSQRFQVCRLSEYDQYNGELIYDGEYDYFENLMGSGSAGAPPPGQANSNAGADFGDTRTGISSSDSFGGFGGTTADRFRGSAAGTGVDSTGSRTDSRTDFRDPRPPGIPGLFRPISTDFNDRDTFNSNNNRGMTNRNTATFGAPRPGGSIGGGSIGGGSIGGGGSSLGLDRFGSGNDRFAGSTGTRNRFETTRDHDRLATGVSLGTGRFGGAGPDLTSNLFGTKPGSSFGGLGALGGGGSGGSFGLGGGSGGVSTSSLGTMAGEGSIRGLPEGSLSSAPINFRWGTRTAATTNDLPNVVVDDFRGSGGISFNGVGGLSGSSGGLGGSSGGFGGSIGGLGGSSPPVGVGSSSCYDSNSFEIKERGLRLRHPYIRRYVSVGSRGDCSQECLTERLFFCKSYNFRYSSLRAEENCQLSDRSSNSLDIRKHNHFESDVDFDFYELDGSGGDGARCPHVAQSCNEDGSMEFTLRTEDPFRGRIYAYGFYDRCFFVGRGSTVSVLQLSAPRGFPDCGTVRYGDSMTNIVVVQFSENVQTMMDKRYNLTCTTIGPSDSVVTSGYIGAGYGAGVAGATSGAGAPTPIEYLELENRLDHRVALRVLYDGRPTTTIAVGDPLTFRLEPQAGYNLVSDIFATNVVAKDPYSGRAVQLIDSRGCPVDNYIFPALGRARSGDGLETRFSAFKIPESNFLVFEANVRPCKNACTPAFCRDTHGRGEVESYGRKRRSLEDQLAPVNETSYVNMTPEQQQQLEAEKLELENVPMEHVHGIYEVYLSRDDIPVSAESRFLDEVCLSASAYHGLMVATVSSILCLLLVMLAAWLLHRRQARGGVAAKNARADAANPQRPLHQEASRAAFPGAHPRTVPQPARYFPDPKPDELALPSSDAEGAKPPFIDPSEPIYTDPTLFERAASSSGSSSRGFQV